jgi:uncharacterized protein (UPF0332 family)
MELAVGLWERALDSIRVARISLPISPDAAASRAYYAGFYAVSAHFALAGRSFRKHSALEAAVHRDLVKGGGWPADFGAKYSALVELRTVGDYGDLEHVPAADAQKAIDAAAGILQAIYQANASVFTKPQ